MQAHLRRWAAIYILLVLFAGAWTGQAYTQQAQIEAQGWVVFWRTTLASWQAIFLQVAVQAFLLMAAKHWLLASDAEDLERIEGKLDRLLDRLGGDDG